MSDHDAAFLWETEALRDRRQRPDPPAEPADPPSAEPPAEPQGAWATPAAPPDLAGPPPGTMIVPIAAWDKMLMQLGNLHEAGQQLAEARERAGKAETEARFLRERLAELRADLAAARPAPTPPDAPQPPAPAPVAASAAPPVTPAGRAHRLWAAIGRRWVRRR